MNIITPEFNSPVAPKNILFSSLTLQCKNRDENFMKFRLCLNLDSFSMNVPNMIIVSNKRAENVNFLFQLQCLFF